VLSTIFTGSEANEGNKPINVRRKTIKSFRSMEEKLWKYLENVIHDLGFKIQAIRTMQV
jgi:hypothetical protein